MEKEYRWCDINNNRDTRKLAVFNLKKNKVLLIPPRKTALEERVKRAAYLQGLTGVILCGARLCCLYQSS